MRTIPRVLEQFVAVKREKKQQLCEYIREKEGVILQPDFLFDVQIKRLHEYKRQLLNAFSILDIYFGTEGRAASSEFVSHSLSLRSQSGPRL